MILVVGASGCAGRETARQLLALGHMVRAASRKPESIADLAQLGAEVVQADLIDPASLVAACRRTSMVFVAAHSLTGVGRYASERVDGDGHRALVDAACAAGVKRFVYTSARGVSPQHPIDFFRTKAAVERHLAASGLDYAILRPTAFMEWHVHRRLGQSIVENGKATVFGSGRNPANFIAATDVARFAVRALTDSRASGATLEIGGPDNVSKRDIVALYEEATGRRAAVRYVPVGAMRALAPLVRQFQPVLGRLMAAAIWSETTDQRFDAAALPAEERSRLTRVEDFVREHAGPRASHHGP
jgi:uncharacterized protein YbjT (DUF2867 family)